MIIKVKITNVVIDKSTYKIIAVFVTPLEIIGYVYNKHSITNDYGSYINNKKSKILTLNHNMNDIVGIINGDNI